MKELIAGFPGQLKDAVSLFRKQHLPVLSSPVKQVLISGLGGSGIGGTILAELCNAEGRVPVLVSKDYAIPEWVGPETLVIISSYSGNTEETLESLQKAIQKKAFIVCVSSGGKISEIAAENNIPLILIPGGHPPRACLGYSFTQLCGIVSYYGILPGAIDAIEQAANLIEQKQKIMIAEAEAIARSISFSVPVIYTTTGYEGIAIRFRQQLNENAKMLCWHHVIPEMNHNELVGWSEHHPKMASVFLRNKDEYYRTSRRVEICHEIIAELSGKTLEVRSEGDNAIERNIYWIHLGDWISWFASVERNRDAMEINVINRLKNDLSALP